MNHTYSRVACLSLSLWAATIFADARPLDTNNIPKGSVSASKLEAAHGAISHKLSLGEAKLAILRATITNRKVKWILEEEGEGYMIFRWDYARKTIYTRIEYNENYVQMKYAGASEDFICDINLDGICYENESRKYYNYMHRLKKSLTKSLQS